MKGTLDSGQKTRWTRHFSNIFLYDESVSDKRENNDVYGPTPDIADTSPCDHPDLRRSFTNPSHAGEARWNPNCLAEAKDMRINETKIGDVRETLEGKR